MTINELLNHPDIAQRIQDSSISPVSVTIWINDFEFQNAYSLRQSVYTRLYYPEDKDKQLLLPEEYTNIYVLYLSAMIDFFSGDFNKYNDSAMIFENAYNSMKANLEFELKME